MVGGGRPILFLDCGDRVGLMVRVRVRDSDDACEALVVNTHLLFPHNPYSTRIRLREVQKVRETDRQAGTDPPMAGRAGGGLRRLLCCAV